ncbi:MAG TPA: hypothetical protein VMI35_03615 [Puia sp.]|nr:hypothetical protein [Puia sp.]
MKKIMLLSFAILMGTLYAEAQTSFEMIPTGGYTFSDQVNFANSYGRIEESLNWGGSLMFNATRNFGIELMYNRIDASSGIYTYGSQSIIQQQNVGINYIMAGPVMSVGFGEAPLHLFFGGLMGAAIFDPGPADNSSNTKFAWGLETGTNLYVSPRLGIRLKAQVLSPVDGASGGFYFGSFGGAVGVSGYSSIYQFGFSGGLIIGLGKVLPRRTYGSSHSRPAPQRYYYRSPYPPPPPYYYH